jgi:predicted SAM-dependent methyltransferase
MDEIINNAKKEFDAYLKKWTIKDNRFMNGIDVGCGTSRIDDMILSIDQQADYRYAHAQLVWNCHDLELFQDGVLDFVFSSHCLEDFEDIEVVFMHWWKKLKVDGLLLLLLPDMENCSCEFCKGGTRYAKVGEGGNPSHRTNVGKKYLTGLLQNLYEKGIIKYVMLQQDTIPHNVSCSIDFVIQKKR